MTISTSEKPRMGLKGLFRRKSQNQDTAEPVSVSKKPLDAADVARLFDKRTRNAGEAKPAQLSDLEVSDSAQMSTLRGALYADN